MLYDPIYDPDKTFEDNYKAGPTGEYLRAPHYKAPGSPTYELFGQRVHLPFGVPAGPLFNSRYVSVALNVGYDVCVYKTVRSTEKPCAPYPNIVPIENDGRLTIQKAHTDGVIQADTYAEPLAITNSFGVPSVSPDVWQPDMKKAVAMAGEGQMVIGAFQGTNRGDGEAVFIKDHAVTARMVRETGARVYEVNTSCPNEGTNNLLCYDLDRMERVVDAIKGEIGEAPLIVKLAYFEDDAQLEDLISRIGHIVGGIAAINTIGAKVLKKDGSQALPGQGRLWAGVCGAPIKWAGVDMVRRLNDIRNKRGLSYQIVGVGGVTAPADYTEYRTAGADCVMSATGMMWNPYLAEQIAKIR